jgi:hypothetical protein
MAGTRTRVAVAVACALFAAACESSTGPAAENLAVALEFDVSRPAFFPDFSNLRDANSLVVRGRIQTLCRPSEGTASVSRQGDTLVLAIESTAVAGCVVGQVVTSYNATITGYTSLRRLRVIHRWPGSDQQEVVAYESVWE